MKSVKQEGGEGKKELKNESPQGGKPGDIWSSKEKKASIS